MTEHTFERGDHVSYQCAGMVKPEYGTLYAMARQPGYCFVRFNKDKHGKLTHFDTLKFGFVESWWRQDADGKWWSRNVFPNHYIFNEKD